MSISQAKVKSVLSGDTLVLTSVNNPEQERLLSLAYVTAPRLRREGDEPFAFQSRDYLRKLVVGKVVQFSVLYTIPTGSKREYGRIYLQSGATLPEEAILEGMVKMRDDAGRRDESDQAKDMLDSLEAREEKAKSSAVGLWASSSGVINVKYESQDATALAEKYKGTAVDAVVEKVFSGDRMILRFLFSPKEHLQTMIVLAGIKAPGTKRNNPSDGKEIPAEPYGNESFRFVDSRLLQRTVKATIRGTTPQGGLICSIHHPKGNIAEILLKAGLARCVDFHSTILGGEMAILRRAEKQGKDARLGLFHGLVQTASNGKETDVIVTRVQTADTIYIRDKSGSERRVNLSSIRQPKPSDPKQAPYQSEAKEFLRKRLIGKHVKVVIDGKKEASEGYEARDVVSLNVNGKNIALQVVEAGHASVIRHRHDDTDRSPIYDDLLVAEATAQQELKGMWSPKAPSSKAYQDYSETLQKAKVQASVLQRQKRIPAIVDYVKGASRFTVLIPRENAKLTFVLSGIRAPRSARSATETGEPFGQEAHDFANRRCLQRDVEIDVEGTDKIGGFIGTLYVNRENFAKLLVEEGLASVHAYSAEQSNHGPELFTAEEHAKEAKRGIWHDYDPELVIDFEELSMTSAGKDEKHGNGTYATNGSSIQSNEAALKKDYRDVFITHIDPSNMHLKFQVVGNSTSGALTSMTSAFRAHHNSSNLPIEQRSLVSGMPKTGEVVAARYSGDSEWYRARVKRNDREAKASDVVFIDYGNGESIPWVELRPLGPVDKFGLQRLRPQAIDGILSYVQWPLTNADYIDDAVRYLQDATDGRQLVASVDAEDGGTSSLFITLFDPQLGAGTEEESVNADVVEEGLAMVARKLKSWEVARGGGKILPALKKAEGRAKDAKKGMWEYGDISDD